MTTHNWGIIGLGRIGKLHADNIIKYMPNVNLAAVSDVMLDNDWLAQREIGHAYSEAEPILCDPNIDAVLICSPTPTHVPLIVAAAQAGKHIFCEKPLALSIEPIRAAMAAADKASVKLQIGFNRRFDPHFAKAYQSIRDGEIGDPHLIRITSYDPSPPSLDYIKKSGGLFLDMSIHDFDMARFLTGSEIVQVYATGAVLVDPAIGNVGDIDTAVTQLKFASGMLGVIDNSRHSAYGYDQRVEVFGNKGSIEVANQIATNTRLSTCDGVIADKPLHFFLDRYQESYRQELLAFYQSIVNDTASPVDGYAGLQSVVISLAATQSYQSHQPVNLEAQHELSWV